ncbi:MAG: hypothetical protein Q4D91_08515 [Lautropia sp.]|nr:hypothetical protein [Lautropia sp.]
MEDRLHGAVRHGKEMALLRPEPEQTPEQEQTALEALKHLWAGDISEVDLQAPEDLPPEPVPSLGG